MSNTTWIIVGILVLGISTFNLYLATPSEPARVRQLQRIAEECKDQDLLPGDSVTFTQLLSAKGGKNAANLTMTFKCPDAEYYND